MEKQYLQLLSDIKGNGTYKSAAREGMPGTYSLFGYQMRHNLQHGFPLLTTKKLSFKNIVTELLWFLRGDTNIKYLVDNGCNIWNEDAYNFYLKQIRKKEDGSYDIESMSFDTFVERVKDNRSYEKSRVEGPNYRLGDCGKQYGWLWRNWQGEKLGQYLEGEVVYKKIDQLQELLTSLKNNPMSRRSIITAWNPATLDDMALNACHAFVQFNCRPLDFMERRELYYNKFGKELEGLVNYDLLESQNIPKYYLDCQMYQRSADVFLGVPYNIASYALLTEILCKICNMISGDFIHTFGDVHIYEDHMDAVNEQLTRTPTELPTLKINGGDLNNYYIEYGLDKMIELISTPNIFELENYNPHPAIKAKLSTGLK